MTVLLIRKRKCESWLFCFVHVAVTLHLHDTMLRIKPLQYTKIWSSTHNIVDRRPPHLHVLYQFDSELPVLSSGSSWEPFSLPGKVLLLRIEDPDCSLSSRLSTMGESKLWVFEKDDFKGLASSSSFWDSVSTSWPWVFSCDMTSTVLLVRGIVASCNGDSCFCCSCNCIQRTKQRVFRIVKLKIELVSLACANLVADNVFCEWWLLWLTKIYSIQFINCNPLLTCICGCCCLISGCLFNLACTSWSICCCCCCCFGSFPFLFFSGLSLNINLEIFLDILGRNLTGCTCGL